jgi:hypothetical protein
MKAERRIRRSHNGPEALQYVLEALYDRSDARAVALIDTNGQVIAGTGTWKDLQGLATITPALDRGKSCEQFEAATEGTDYFSSRIGVTDRTVYLAALGTRLRRLHDAIRGVLRILGPAESPA